MSPATISASANLFDRARHAMPGGVNSPVRSFSAVGGMPRFIERAEGAILWDVDGRPYVDLVGSWGAAILGHAHPRVTEAIARAASAGASYGLVTQQEIELAEVITDRVPNAERVRMVNSGTEAVMSAIRLARAATGRSRIIKLEGCYHGHADDLLASAGSGVATLGLSAAPSDREVITIPFGDARALDEALRAHRNEVAAVILEPVAGNMGVIPPPEGYLDRAREATRDLGALLIVDEVMTGFRLARGGAIERFSIEPDLVTFGKVIGGCLPVGAYAGRADLMEMIAPSGPVYQAGTMSGNPVVVAAGLATLSELDDRAYERLEILGARLERGLTEVFANTGVPTRIHRVASMISVFFTDSHVRNFEDAKRSPLERFARFFHAMLDRGVHLPPSGLESWFVSLAHDKEVIDDVIEAAQHSAREIQSA